MSPKSFRKIVPIYCSLMLVLAACGGGSSSLSPDADLGVLSPTEQMIFSKYYAGELVVYLDDEMQVYGTSKSLAVFDDSLQSKLSVLQKVVSKYDTAELQAPQGGVVTKGAVQELTKAKERFKRITGKDAKETQNILRVIAPDESQAIRLLRDLKTLSGVQLVYPAMQRSLSGAMDSVPELVGYQQYLDPLSDEHGNFLGGLNIKAAREQYQVESASDVWVVDEEFGWNPSHPDLGLDYNGFAEGGNMLAGNILCLPEVMHQLSARERALCQRKIEHGTAVMGVLGALENNGGVEGIVPSSANFLLIPSGNQNDVLLYTSDAIDIKAGDDFKQRNTMPGSIWLIETHSPGLLSHIDPNSPGDCLVSVAPEGDAQNPADPYAFNPCYGFVPAEADLNIFNGIQQASDYGITVIEGAGNGGVDISDPQFYLDEQQHVLQGDSGAIIVGASLGADFQKHPASNCGSRVDVFAWGQNVVTTGWAYPGSDMDWLDLPGFGQDPSDPNAGAYYVNNFRGTSSATAIIGGVAGLMQSFAKQELGSRSRYLMPAKIREILIASGVSQAGNDCNIGVQPQADEALRLIREFVQQAKVQYPELANNQPLSAERIQSLRNLGVGLICENYEARAPSVNQPGVMIYPDASCNEEVVWPVGSRIAKDLDFDGDNRAELVKWTRDGGWQVDLSSVGGGEFGFGAWNITVNNPAGLGEWVSPYAIDLDSDGRTDLVLYDRENNVWNVLYTRWSILQGSQGQWQEIQYDTNDWVDDRKLDWKHSNYSRPVPGDYNGDGWVDIAIACSDGIWRIDYSDEGEFDGAWDENITFLDEAKLEAAPGWAWLPQYMFRMNGDYLLSYISYRAPDGANIGDAGDLVISPYNNMDVNANDRATKFAVSGNEDIALFGVFKGIDVEAFEIGAKRQDGTWPIQHSVSLNDTTIVVDTPEVDGIFGGSECHPTAADFDGDSLTDRAVLCPDGWTVAYSAPQGEEYISRRYTGNGMGYDADEFTVPGRVYFGGISYAKSVQLINFALQANPHQAPPIPVDMVTPFVGGD